MSDGRPMRTGRAFKALDALSQLANVLCLPRHHETDANESISARAHRMGWRAERWIDALFFWQPHHCRTAYERDVARARAYGGGR